MLRIHFTPEDLARVRMAYNPLTELSMSYRILRGNWHYGLYWRWIEEANQSLQGMTFPFMEALITRADRTGYSLTHTRGYIPDFLTPTSAQIIPDIDTALQHLEETPDEVLRASIEILIDWHGTEERIDYFLAHPREALGCLLAELRTYWQRTLANHWESLRNTLERDMLRNARTLMLDGVETVLGQLNATTRLLRVKDELLLEYCKPVEADLPQRLVEHHLTGRGIVISPLVFGSNGIWHQFNEPWQPSLLYGAYGAGQWQLEAAQKNEALELALGAAKADVLTALRTPASTSDLARQLSLTAGAVSQQLGKLNQAGLVHPERVGKRVYYRLSDRGEKLLALFG